MSESILEAVISNTPDAIVANPSPLTWGDATNGVKLTDVAKDPTSVAKADRLARYLEQGLAKAGKITEYIQRNRPVDVIAGARRLSFARLDDSALDVRQRPVVMNLDLPGGPGAIKTLRLHRNAVTQLATRLDVPGAYVSELLTGSNWQRDLATKILNEETAHAPVTVLVREVNGEARAVLSDRFQRKDTGRMWDAFAGACSEVGAVPADATVDDLSVWVRALIPTIYTAAGEPVCFGIEWANSDFGVRANCARLFTLRTACLNGMIGEVARREVHLGGRLAEEDDISFSEKTHDLNSQASASKLADVVKGYLSPERIAAQIAALDGAADAKIDPDKASKWMKKSQGKGRAEEILEAYRSAEVEMLPAGDTAWRLSNAASWVAKKATSVERQHELEELAAELLQPVTLKQITR